MDSMSVVEASRRLSHIMGQSIDSSIIAMMCERNEIPHHTIPAPAGSRLKELTMIDEDELEDIVAILVSGDIKKTNPEYLTAREAAALIGVNKSTINNSVKNGNLKVAKTCVGKGRYKEVRYYFKEDILKLKEMLSGHAGIKIKRKEEKMPVKEVETKSDSKSIEDLLNRFEARFCELMDQTRAEMNDIYKVGYADGIKKGREEERARIAELLKKED